LFLYVNDLPAEMKDVLKTTLFVKGISLIVTTFDSRQLLGYFSTIIGKITAAGA
jgi:hypothetical protein